MRRFMLDMRRGPSKTAAMPEFDVAVAGLGAMGSAALAACADRGLRCAGFDRFAPPHVLGASSGKSRLIRQAYFEDPCYVPLVLRAYELWRELESRTGTRLLRQTGLLAAGPADGILLGGTLESARRFDLPVQCLDAAQVRRRYPQVQTRSGEAAVFEEAGGMLAPELAVRAQIDAARAAGAEIYFGAALETWTADSAGVELRFESGDTVRAKRLILALGPWARELLQKLGVAARVQRNVQVWFSPASHAYDVAAFPAFLLERSELPAILYGFPDAGDGVKAAFHGLGETTGAEHADRAIHPQTDVVPVARALESWMPGAASTFLEAKACLYTLTPDEHFVVDVHPEHPRAIVLGGFSGHGFKFAPVIGEIAAQLALDGGTPHPIARFSLRRFS